MPANIEIEIIHSVPQDISIDIQYIGETVSVDLVDNEAPAIAIEFADAGPAGLSAYQIAVQQGFVGDEDAWLLSIKGADGQDGGDGSNVEFQKSATHIQWRYVGGGTWFDLVPLADLKGSKGDTGDAGDNGREIELQKTLTHLQWRYVGDVSWSDLLALIDINGDAGNDGDDGREVELNNSGTHIQWRYVGVLSWTNLVALSALKGDTGDDGRSVELNISVTHIQWRLVGDSTWIDLVPLSAIKGETGDDGLSAYQIALANGFVGSESAWLLSLKGETGDNGADGLATLTTIEKDLGSVPRKSGRFIISGAGMTTGKPVLVTQASGPYTGKGTRTDEAEADTVIVKAKVISSTEIECFWSSATFVKGNFKFDYFISN